jgi:hypothetical protein
MPRLTKALGIGAAVGVAILLCWSIVPLGAQQVPFAPDAGAAGAAPAQPAPRKDMVRIQFYTVPASNATVMWGKKRLGVMKPKAPVVVYRPRDSGPLDVLVRADGFLPVQTRAFTFADSKVSVKLTRLDQKQTLLGYKQEVLPPDGGAEQAPDGGVPLSGPWPSR